MAPSRNARPAIDATQNSVTSCEAFEDVDQLLDFIEGNRKEVANEKKRAKKERQKQQKIKASIEKEGEKNLLLVRRWHVD